MPSSLPTAAPPASSEPSQVQVQVQAQAQAQVQQQLVVVDNSTKSYMEVISNCHADFFTVWLGRSPLKLWIRIWLFLLLVGVLSPLAFLPHPYSITNLVGMVVILCLNGPELARVRGINKNMGWPHLPAWIPVVVVDVLSLSTDLIDGQQLTWTDATTSYQQARYVFVWFNLVTLTISCVFDAFDTYQYYVNDVKDIERSDWTTHQLQQQKKQQQKQQEEEQKPAGAAHEEATMKQQHGEGDEDVV